MTQQEASDHWRKGARDAIDMAQLGYENGKFALSLFHCHLAAEKILKAVYINERKQDPPPTHHLLSLALQLRHQWSRDEEQKLIDLTDYAIAARYDDPTWAERYATAENTANWLIFARELVHRLSP